MHIICSNLMIINWLRLDPNLTALNKMTLLSVYYKLYLGTELFAKSTL